MPRRHLTGIGMQAALPSALQFDPAQGIGSHPRPQLRRPRWHSLNGEWEFVIDVDGRWREPTEVTYERTIQVPFAPECKRSGVEDAGLYRACWYRTSFEVAPLAEDERLILHFAAVDYLATVWVNGLLACRHEGGYTPFSVDVTEMLRDNSCEVVLRAFDDPADMSKPRGKQDWQLFPHSIWYPRTTGIWQTVWYEVIPRRHIHKVRWAANMERWELGFETHISGVDPVSDAQPLWLSLRLYAHGLVLADDRYLVIAGEVHRRVALSDPGIDDFRNELLWSPEKPTLIEAELTLLDAAQKPVDTVFSYTALRAFTVDKDRLMLNGRPYQLRMVLDQGYWPETGLTPPDESAIQLDIQLAKRMGFNGVRKHQKIEDPRYLYWADRLGLLVWEEMPSAYRFTSSSVTRVTKQWLEVLERDMSHPCIIAWVPFNESWGVPNLPDSASERNYVQALYYLTKSMDPTRPLIGNDGWESVATDIIGIHDYDDQPARLATRYSSHGDLAKLLKGERPGGRVLSLAVSAGTEHPVVLSEFGGIALTGDTKNWGYATAVDASELERLYTELLSRVRALPMLSGFCYTQFADTYQEANGLLYADRTPKFPIERIAVATRGGFKVKSVPE
ncbi:MAG TPA: glycoside hydrolase family 2 TIM barrel-domain containing protein, partial [Polyangiaceae bacterium]